MVTLSNQWTIRLLYINYQLDQMILFILKPNFFKKIKKNKSSEMQTKE